MLNISTRFTLSLLGPFRLTDVGGEPMPITSKKGMALIAMLATAPNGERPRTWLQNRLWGSRGDAQARASMRRELANLRRALGAAWDDLVQVDSGRVRLRLERVNVDVVRMQPEGWAPAGAFSADADFLEGIDVLGEESFADWLKLVRTSLAVAGGSHLVGTGASRGQPGREIAEDSAHEANALVRIWLPPEVHAGPELASSTATACVAEIAGWLARVRWLRVLSGDTAAGARSSSTVAAGAEPTYRVERVILRSSAQERVELRLLLARTNELVWSESLLIETTGAVATGASLRLCAQLAARIEREEQNRAMRAEYSDHDFKTLIWRSRWHVNRLSRSDAASAARLVDRALALAPRSPEALIQKAVATAWEKWAHRAPRREFGALSELAGQVMRLDPDDCRGYWLAGVAETWLGNSNAAVAWLRRAIEIEPTFEPAYTQLGGTLNLSDRPSEALEVLTVALSLSPNDTHLFFRHCEFALSAMLLGRFTESVEWADQALLLRPGYWFAQTIKIHSLVSMGRRSLAESVVSELKTLHPGFSIDYLAWAPFVDRAWPDRIMASVLSATAPAGAVVAKA